MPDYHDYIVYSFYIDPPEPASEILMAELAEKGFESFEELKTGIKAYIRRLDWSDNILSDISILNNPDFDISFNHKLIEAENWNAKWEQDFSPIEVDGRCTVRASFHEPAKTEYDIEIDPKMSFGTGHHETTHLMIKMMLDMDFNDKSVLDMGCGTAVLAILAEQKGAKKVLAIDLDPWSYRNALENLDRNKSDKITVREGDVDLIDKLNFDIIIANINRNVLLEHIPFYSSALNEGGQLLLSGFYSEDIPTISSRCLDSGLSLSKKLERNNWVSLKFIN
ncbi:MAG: 50S ribosomal protein L11 methyltransferase [Flavobacteriaceae bacterium]|nr:50S ribosomal protein L11 methyltransferase [Flavobacteriaceae bacterium]